MLYNKQQRSGQQAYFLPYDRTVQQQITDLLFDQLCSHLSFHDETIVRLASQNHFRGFDYPMHTLANRSLRENASLLQIVGLYSKNAAYRSKDAKTVALEKWCECELTCARINQEYSLYGKTVQALNDPDYESITFLIRRKIQSILGDVPSLDDLQLMFGSGSNTTIKKNTTARFKLNAVPVVSKEAFTSFEDVGSTAPIYHFLHKGKCRIGLGKLTFVPKSAKTDRPILIEPIINTFVQKGIGSYIKGRLLKAGCNLYDQTINRNLARDASITGTHATLDLSSASDLISFAVVCDLLPLAWVEFLTTWRTGKVASEDLGLIIDQNKFSSMGNGFTFELESLIFYAICSVDEEVSNLPHSCNVFGDDIIVRTERYDRVCSLLANYGFVVNSEKSFSTGPFRESCGGDYYNGINIRPLYVKDAWSPHSLVSFLNYDLANHYFLDDYAREYIINTFIPAKFRNYGPAGFGDGYIHDHNADLPRLPGSGLRVIRSVKTIARRSRLTLPIGDDLLPLYTIYQKPPIHDMLISRRRCSGWYIRTIALLLHEPTDPTDYSVVGDFIGEKVSNIVFFG